MTKKKPRNTKRRAGKTNGRGDLQRRPPESDSMIEHLAVSQRSAATLGLMMGLPADEALGEGQRALARLVGGVGAQDPLEVMLVEELALCHERVLSLSLMAVQRAVNPAPALVSTLRHANISIKATPQRPASALAIHEQCDKAMNTLRRGMLALREYRGANNRPVLAIQQINQGEAGHVVVSAGVQPEKR